MLPINEELKFKGEEIISVLNEIELILISLHKIGAFFGEKDYAGKDKQAYEYETNRFIDEWKVTRRLSKIRTILSEKFDTTLGDDDMDDLERSLGEMNYWKSPDSKP